LDGRTCEGINQVSNRQWAQSVRKIQQDAKKEGDTAFSENHFYARQDELCSWILQAMRGSIQIAIATEKKLWTAYNSYPTNYDAAIGA
jgi:hypothetical protein